MSNFDDYLSEEEYNNDKLDDLLKGIEENRSHYSGMLSDITKLRAQLDKLLPDTMDYRKKFLFEERMKTITSVIGMELDIRKSLEASYKTEIELRRKLISELEDDELSTSERIELMTKALSKLGEKSE